MLHAEYPKALAEIETEIVSHGRWDGQIIHTKRDGSKVVVSSRWALLSDGQNRPSAILEINTDITERQAIDRMKSEFVSVVSHELRTPLTAIRGALGLLASGLLGAMPAKGQQMLDIAVSNTDRLVRLINDILDIERMDSGKVTMTKVTCDAAELMGQVRDLLRTNAEKAGEILQVEPLPARLWADPDRISQTMINLVGNAIQFSSPGGTVWFTAEERGDELVFQVRDEGRGIPTEKLEHIFERFYQVDASDSREKGGTGLGLAICQTIVLQHDGRIWAESELCRGSTFAFTVPLLKRAEPKPLSDSYPATVLICDDDPSIRAVVKTMGEHRGYRVLQAASGEEAVRLAITEQPTAILLDLVMPGVDGAQTMEALHTRPETTGIPIIVHSAFGPEETEHVISGAAAWLRKPPTAAALLKAIEAAVGKHDPTCQVLVVEDDKGLSSVLTAILRQQGVRTVTARTGAEAIAVVRMHPPDLLLLDLALPDGDGYDVVDWLRRQDRLRGLPIVVYTASDLDDVDRDRLRLEPTEFLTKGHIDPEEAVQRMVGLLDRVTSAA